MASGSESLRLGKEGIKGRVNRDFTTPTYPPPSRGRNQATGHYQVKIGRIVTTGIYFFL
jgi:hypothetical protein